jgi:hypothetical protein
VSNLTRRTSPGCVAIVLVVAAMLAGCGIQETGQTQPAPAPSPLLFPANVPTIQPTVQASPGPFMLGPLVESDLDPYAPPETVPLDLQIPSLKVNAPVVAVGLTSGNIMDSPKGPISDPIWGTAFWYRLGGVPGDVGVATIAGHVDDPLGGPEIFAHLGNLHSGDLIIIHLRNTTFDIRFKVDKTVVYSVQQSSDPAVLTQIFGAGPVAGTAPQPSPDGLSHLTLVTCAGYIVAGKFDHHTVVYSTRIP